MVISMSRSSHHAGPNGKRAGAFQAREDLLAVAAGQVFAFDGLERACRFDHACHLFRYAGRPLLLLGEGGA